MNQPCNEVNKLVESSNNSFVVENFTRLQNLCPEEAAKIPSIIPIKNLATGRVSSGYGTRQHPILKTIKHHGGIDIACSDSIIVTADGVVQKIDFSTTLGKFIVVNHNNGYQTKYGHLNKILTFEGEILKLGQVIGISGATGRATGNHLHYIIVKNNVEINPTNNLLLYYKNALSR
jgi:murein DD-endopeptidase MepM/ murein hydrolase activator NlpD